MRVGRSRAYTFGLVVIVALVVAMATSGSAASGEVITRVSVDSSGAEANGGSFGASVSSDMRYVAFSSGATNLVTGDTNDDSDVFVRDRQSGTTERVSVDSSGAEVDASSYQHSISSDGRYVAFISEASNLVAGDNNGFRDVFVHDRQSGTTERVSVSSSGAEANYHSDSSVFGASLSSNGRYVVFVSAASNLVTGDTNNNWDIFVRDRDTDGDGVFDEAGAVSTERVNVSSSGAETGDVGAVQDSSSGCISSDGRYVTFTSSAPNLVPGDTNRLTDAFVRDRQTGTTERVNVSSSGAEAQTYHSGVGPVSSDGRYVAFRSEASNLVANDTNQAGDMFVRDRQSGTTERVSVGSSGAEANNESGFGCTSLSSDWRYVAFYSEATNLVTGDTNAASDIFVRATDTTLPTVFSVDPREDQRRVRRATNITITFFEEMDTDSLSGDTVKLIKVGRPPVSIPLTMQTSTDGSGRTVLTLDPFGPTTQKLAKKKTYQVTVEGMDPPGDLFAVKDLAGNEMGDDKVWTFRTRRR